MSSWSNIRRLPYVQPTVRKKCNLVIIHTEANDIQDNVSTLQKIRKAIATIKNYDANDNSEIVLSSIILSNEHHFVNKTDDTNRKLENLRKSNGMLFIDTSPIESTFLNRNKLHLYKTVTPLLIKYFSKVMNSVCVVIMVTIINLQPVLSFT